MFSFSHKIDNPLIRQTTSEIVRIILGFAFLLMAATGTQGQAIQDGTTAAAGGASPGAPNGSDPLSAFERINLFNGHLNMNVPIMGKVAEARLYLRNIFWRTGSVLPFVLGNQIELYRLPVISQ